jgi:Leucine-rich repeat (LRR) protein
MNKIIHFFFIFIIGILFSSCVHVKDKYNSSSNNSLENNKLTNNIDDALKHAEQVECLFIYNSSGINKLRKNIALFKNIKELYFDEIPKGLLNTIFQISSELNSLEKIEIHGIRDTVVPGSIGRLRHIKSIELAGDREFTVSDSIVYCFNLKNVTLVNCKSIPSISRLQKLESIDINNNNLKEVPREILRMKNIKELFLFSNNIETLPKEIIMLKQLKKIDLYNNPMAKRELKYYKKYGKYKELDFLSKALPNCEIILEQPLD